MSNTKPRPMDEQDISPAQFLSRVMHEPSLDLAVRMEAADKLLKLGLGNYKEEAVSITIRGGISGDPPMADLSPEAKLDHLRGKRRYELDIINPYVAYWETKGNA